MFRHFLLTRFNLRVEDWKTTKYGTEVLSREWLSDRFHLFETYCLPSVKNQTNQNFTWLVFFDHYTQKDFRYKVEQFAQAYSNFQPVYINGNKEFRQAIIETIKINIKEQDKFIITTRLDNDDIIHKNFISTIQKLFQPINNHIIDLPAGYQLVIEKGLCEIFVYYDRFNPFITLVELKENLKSVFSKEHRHWKEAESVTVYDKEKLWMALIPHEPMEQT